MNMSQPTNETKSRLGVLVFYVFATNAAAGFSIQKNIGTIFLKILIVITIIAGLIENTRMSARYKRSTIC